MSNDIMDRIDALAVKMATEVSDTIIADLHRQGIYDMIGEREFRQTALAVARQTVIDQLNAVASIPRSPDTLADR